MRNSTLVITQPPEPYRIKLSSFTWELSPGVYLILLAYSIDWPADLLSIIYYRSWTEIARWPYMDPINCWLRGMQVSDLRRILALSLGSESHGSIGDLNKVPQDFGPRGGELAKRASVSGSGGCAITRVKFLILWNYDCVKFELYWHPRVASWEAHSGESW
jgi:hypothetical protein